MCQFAAFVLTINKVLWSDKSDSHEDIIREHKLYVDGIRGPNILRVELLPPESNWSDLDSWTYRVDQDRLPEWAHSDDPKQRSSGDCEKRTRAAARERFRRGFSNVQTLDLSGTAVKELPALPNVQYLDLRRGTAVKELPALPNVQTLYLSGTAVKELPALPNIQNLDLSGTAVKELPALPNVQTLYLSGTAVKELPALPNVQYLDLSGTAVKELPALPNVQYLDLSGTAVKKLPALPNVQTLDLRRTAVKDISRVPKQCRILR
jgi:Leucine-rich repeat (LRR) protein